MITISLCMIVKNEEEVLARCLDSVCDLVDEIIIVDTGSTDRTKEIAAAYTDKIYDFEWINDFSAARNFSFGKASMDYQFWMDADDLMQEKDRLKFRKLKEDTTLDIDIVLMKYVLTVDNAGNPVYSLSRERLLKRVNNYLWEGYVHECIPYGGNYIFSDIEIVHREKPEEILSDRNLKIYENIVAKGVSLSSRSLYYYAQELKDHNRNEESIHYYCRFLAENQGTVSDNVNACLEVGNLYLKLTNAEEALKVFFHSFNYALPTAEICCGIAGIFASKKEYKKAIFWYEMVFTLNLSDSASNRMNTDCWNFIPAIELCVCYHAIGNTDKAIYYNNLASSFKPTHSSVLYNRDYLIRVIGKTACYLTEISKMSKV